MAIVYIDPSASKGGGGDGTWGNGYHIEDVLAAGNPKSIAANTILGCMTDGATEYTLSASAALTMPAAFCTILPVSDTVEATASLNRILVDASSQSAGDGLTINVSTSKVFGMQIENAPDDAFYVGASGDYSGLVGCRAVGAGAWGFNLDAGCVNWQLIGNHAEDCVDAYSYEGTNTSPQVFLFNSCEGCGSATQSLAKCTTSYSPFLISMFNFLLADGGSKANDGMACLNSRSIIAHNTIAAATAFNNASDSHAFTTTALIGHLFNNIVANWTNAGVGTGYAFYLTGAANNWAAHNVIGNATEWRGSFKPQLYLPASDTTEAALTGGSPYDPTPVVDLSGLAAWDDLLKQASWMIPGAMQQAAAADDINWPPEPRRHGT